MAVATRTRGGRDRQPARPVSKPSTNEFPQEDGRTHPGRPGSLLSVGHRASQSFQNSRGIDRQPIERPY